MLDIKAYWLYLKGEGKGLDQAGSKANYKSNGDGWTDL